MLVGTLSPSIEHNYYPEFLRKLIVYFSDVDAHSMALGRYDLPFAPMDKAWFVILEYEKQKEVEMFPEVHKNTSDFQVVLSGNETMAWAIDPGDLVLKTEYNPVRDIQFYQRDQVKLNYIAATPGNFYLFTPNTIHITNIENEDIQSVKKLVVKIHNNYLV